jgi:hypothetical protein
MILAMHTYSQEDDQLLVSEIKRSTIITQPSTLHVGFFKLGTVCSYILIDKMFNDDGQKVYMMGNGWGTKSMYSIDLLYGVTNRFQVLASLPYVRNKMYYSNIVTIPMLQTELRNGSELQGKGIGDLDLGLDYQIIEGSKTKPSLVSKLTITIPTGEENPTNINSDSSKWDLPTGAGEVAVALGFVYRKIIYPLSYTFNGSFKYYFEGKKQMFPDEDPVSFKSGNFYSAGASFNFLLNDWIAIQNDCYFNYFEPSKVYYDPVMEGNSSWSLLYIPEVNFQFKKFRFVQGVSIEVAGKNGGADPTFILIAQYIF